MVGPGNLPLNGLRPESDGGLWAWTWNRSLFLFLVIVSEGMVLWDVRHPASSSAMRKTRIFVRELEIVQLVQYFGSDYLRINQLMSLVPNLRVHFLHTAIVDPFLPFSALWRCPPSLKDRAVFRTCSPNAFDWMTILRMLLWTARRVTSTISAEYVVRYVISCHLSVVAKWYQWSNIVVFVMDIGVFVR